MIVNNRTSAGIAHIVRGAKCQGGYAYLTKGNMSTSDGNKVTIYLVKRTGQRSWTAFELTDNNKDAEMVISGNAGTILDKVWDMHSGELEIMKVRGNDKTLIRKLMMEALAYGTLKATRFEITKQ